MINYSYIPLTAFLVNGFVWAVIYSQRKQNSINKAYLLYSANLSLWVLTVFIMRQPLPEQLLVPLFKAASITWLSISFLFMNFTYIFIDKKKDAVYYTFLLLVLVSISVSLSSYLVISGYKIEYWGPDEIAGPLLLPAVFIMVLLPAVYSLYLIYKKYKSSGDINYRKSLPLLILGSLLSLVLGLTSNVILPVIFGVGKFVQFAESATVIQSFLVYHAVRKYKLFTLSADETGEDLFANLKDAVIILSNNGRILQFNNYTSQLLGDAGITENKNIKDIFDFYGIENNYQDLEITFDSSGFKKSLSLTQAEIKTGADRRGFILIIRDITERKLAEHSLKEREERYRLLVETIPHGVIENDIEGNIIYANRKLNQIHGFADNHLLNKKIWYMALNEEEQNRLMDYMKHILETEPAPEAYFMKNKTAEGNIIDLQVDWNYNRSDNGDIVSFISIVTDITKRRQDEELIKKSKIMLQQAERLAHLGSWEWDAVHDKVTWSDELYRIYGIGPSDFDGTFEGFLSHVHPNDIERVQYVVDRSLTTGLPFRNYERIIRPDGSVRVLYSKGIVHKDENGNIRSLYGSCLDVTDFKKVETELRTSREQLRYLSTSLQNLREEERTTIAREIHDELGQVLTALKMDVSLLSEDISEGINFTPGRIVGELHKMEKLIDELIQIVRDIASELRPDVLDHLGLIAALEWQSKEFQKRNKINCTFYSNTEEINFDRDRATAVFRIFQESLTNIVRHAKCTEVKVSVVNNGNEFILEVSDNGKGITDKEINDVHSIGITGMKERGGILGAELFVSGSPGMGTTVKLVVPLDLDRKVNSQDFEEMV